jgi:peptide/nickel transport system substrate-binding protein
MLPVIERMAEWGDNKGTMVGILAESWDVDPQALTFTWHIRKGVKFHDGTDWNAEACRWNFQMGLDANRLSMGQFIDSLEVADEYTLVMHLNAYNWVMAEQWGLMSPISPTAYESSGATEEARINWARTHAVGTGPFTVADWKRDDYIKFVKNPSYWRKGMPYLDAIEIRYIPDPMVAAASIEAGEADMWFAVSQVQNILDLQEKGFKLNWGPGMFFALLFNSNDPDSIFHSKPIREAFEYALDRPAIAQMLGQGLFEPLHQMAASTWAGYVEGYDPRPYNPDKAREKLAEAGYPNGLQTTMLATSTGQDAIAAMQSYLGEVGIIIEPDVADLGRYFGSVFGTGWKDTVYAASGINPSTTDLYIHFGPNPVTYRTGNIWKSPEYLEKCNAALNPNFKGAADALPGIREAIRQAGEDAMIVPLWRTAEAVIMQTYVHSDYGLIHGILWTPYDDWMEKR